MNCISCCFAKKDKTISNNAWTAYECTNEVSKYYKALLNLSENGIEQVEISWSGCDSGVKR